MRTFLSTFLALLIFACPLVCGAAEAGHGAPRENEAGVPEDRHHSDDCPEDADNCVCQGALQSSDVRVEHSESSAPPFLPFGFGLFGGLAAPRPLASALPNPGGPAGLSSWGDTTVVRALLQIFRF